MGKIIGASVCAVAVFSLLAVGLAKEGAKDSRGEELFKKHCVSCHPDGGNIIKPDRTLGKEALKKNAMETERDIVRLMRNPGPGMVKFGRDIISEKDATAIARYIMTTFK